MSSQTFFKVAGGIFLVIAVLHLLRSLFGWEAVIGGLVIPFWASWLAVLVAGFLAYTGLTQK